MNILLIKPPSKGDHIQPPLGLGYLAAAVDRKHRVRILDMLKENIGISDFENFITREKWDIVGFQLYTIDLKPVKILAELTKKCCPSTITIIGGPHPSICPEETLTAFNGIIDYLFVGESEKAFPGFIEKAEKNESLDDLPGICWRKNGINHISKPSELIADLDSINFLAWDLIKPQEYPPSQHGAFFRNFPIAPIITTRGCPYRCSFCSAPILSGGKIRKRSTAKVLQEIQMLYNEYGIREIHIVDDNFSCDRNHAKGILRAIIDSGLKISLAFPNGLRIETLDEELISLMKKSGVYLISLGIESGTDRVLKLMEKHLDIHTITSKISLIRKYGIDIAGFFVIGFPGETENEIKQTIAFSLALPLIRANYFNFLPLPGTDIYKQLREKGELKDIDWDHFYFMSAPYAPRGISKHKLRMLQKTAFMRFFFRPDVLIKNLMQIQSPRHFWYLLKRFYRWVIS